MTLGSKTLGSKIVVSGNWKCYVNVAKPVYDHRGGYDYSPCGTARKRPLGMAFDVVLDNDRREDRWEEFLCDDGLWHTGTLDDELSQEYQDKYFWEV